jgi:hypothetical protein
MMTPKRDKDIPDEQDLTGYTSDEIKEAQDVAVDSGFLSSKLTSEAIAEAKLPKPVK